MPIYEYQCNDCQHHFETLIRGEESAQCPSCGSERLQKLISAHAIGHGVPDTACGAAPCSSAPACGSGGCSGF